MGVGFSREGARKVADNVRAAKRAPKGGVEFGNSPIVMSAPGFFAKLTDKQGVFYSWTRVKPSASGFVADESWRKGGPDGSGDPMSSLDLPAADMYGSEEVIVPSLAWLMPVSAEGGAVYVFSYSPGVKAGYIEQKIAAGEEGTVKVKHMDDDYVEVTAHNTFTTDVGAALDSDDEDAPETIEVHIAYEADLKRWIITAEDCGGEEDDEAE